MDVSRVLVAAFGTLISVLFAVALPLFLAFGMNDGTSDVGEWISYIAFLSSIPAFILGVWKPFASSIWLLGVSLIWASWMIFEFLKIQPFPFSLFLGPHLWPAYLTAIGGLLFLWIRHEEDAGYAEQVPKLH